MSRATSMLASNWRKPVPVSQRVEFAAARELPADDRP
jgi:hypothetical protein